MNTNKPNSETKLLRVICIFIIKVQSANAARNKTDDQECHGTNETLDNSNNDVENDSSSNEKPGAPAILKYHREKKDIPKVACKNSLHSSHGKDSDEDEELPPTHGLFNGPCQFCGKPILTVAIQESIDDPIPVDQVCFCKFKKKMFMRSKTNDLYLTQKSIGFSLRARENLKEYEGYMIAFKSSVTCF